MIQFARDFVSSIEGTRVDISTRELPGRARIHYIFNDVFGNALANLGAMASLEDQDVKTDFIHPGGRFRLVGEAADQAARVTELEVRTAGI